MAERDAKIKEQWAIIERLEGGILALSATKFDLREELAKAKALIYKYKHGKAKQKKGK
jgi:hypothetical protein